MRWLLLVVAVVLPLGRVKGGERAQAGTNVVIEVCERREMRGGEW